MKYKVLIKHLPSGAERLYSPDEEFNDHTVCRWAEGNYECDCNRHLFFNLANGVDVWDEQPPCNKTKEDRVYVVPRLILDNGTVFPVDLP